MTLVCSVRMSRIKCEMRTAPAKANAFTILPCSGVNQLCNAFRGCSVNRALEDSAFAINIYE